MRTNIVLNDALVEEAMQYTGASSKRALVEEALRTLIEVRAGERKRASYRDRVCQLDLRLRDLRLRERPSELLRADRERH